MATMKKRQETASRSVAEQAAEWLLILEDATREDNERFADWLRRSPLHVGAFLRASTVDTLARNIDPDKSMEIDAGPFSDIVEVAAPGGATEQPPTRGSRTRLTMIAMAASIFAVAIVGAFLVASHLSARAWKHYTAAVGEIRVLELEDGSVLYLGAGSSVATHFNISERSLRLTSGEALFKVAHDASRPFRVHSGNTIVQAIGTQFRISKLRDDSVISVVEGVVQVTRERTLMERLVAPIGLESATPRPTRLKAGQETRAAADGQLSAPGSANPDPVKNWRQRRLTFVNDTLYDIAEEFNRYNRTPKIRVADAAAGELRFAAAFTADDPQSLAAVLGLNPQLTIQVSAEEIVISSH